MYCLAVLEAGSPKSRGGWGPTPPESSREGCVPGRSPSSGSFLARGGVTLTLTWPSRPGCLCPDLPCLKNTWQILALHIRWPKYWNFSFSHSPSNEYSGLISFRIDWFDLLADKGTFESLPQHHSSKTTVLQCSAIFMGQLSHPYRGERKL